MRRVIARLIRRWAGRAMRYADRVEYPGMTPGEIKRMRSYAKAIRAAQRTRVVQPVAISFDSAIPEWLRASCTHCGCLACERGDCGPVCTFGDW